MARREVILCAGAGNSPALLELSGIGDARRLRSLGVEVAHDLPGVGANPHDHLGAYVQNQCSEPVTLNPLYGSARGFVAIGQAMRELLSQRAFDRFRGPELAPGSALGTDKQVLSWISQNAKTVFHPVGSCAMGTDERAVVNERLEVLGLSGVRVADASVMPRITSGNTSAPTIMVAEKAAEMIRRSR